MIRSGLDNTEQIRVKGRRNRKKEGEKRERERRGEKKQGQQKFVQYLKAKKYG